MVALYDGHILSTLGTIGSSAASYKRLRYGRGRLSGQFDEAFPLVHKWKVDIDGSNLDNSNGNRIYKMTDHM